jgi:hypothetical protein
MTQITNFDNVSVGTNKFSSIQVFPIRGHEHNGIYATIFDFSTNDGKLLQLRRKGNYYALFMSEYNDTVLPEYWQDSELILDLGS